MIIKLSYELQIGDMRESGKCEAELSDNAKAEQINAVIRSMKLKYKVESKIS